jgi:hypothetical protein
MSYDLCCTPRVEQLRLFMRAQAASLPQDDLAATIFTGLRALLSMDPITQSMKITPVHGGHLGIDVSLQDNEFKVDVSCFEHTKMHQNFYCDDMENKPGAEDYVFTCDHATHHLYELMLCELAYQVKARIDSDTRLRLKTKARAKIQQMPRAIHLSTNTSYDIPYISWTSVEPCNKAHEAIRVALHSEKCTADRKWDEKLLHRHEQSKCSRTL